MRKQDFEFLLNLLRKYAGWNFDEEQYFVVDKKISNFIREKGYADVEDLVAELRLGAAPLISQVVESLALSDTSFFRDYDVFNRFEKSLLPTLRESNRASKRLRIWSLGCSTGQEAYSIAICIRNQFLGLSEWNIDIVGSDISSVAISKAQRGIYNNFEIQTGMNIRTILKYFHKEGEQWGVNDDLRRMVEFRRYNMLDDITLSNKFEVIFCRNVLRFFTPEHQREILSRLSNYQTQGGILYLGKNEYISGIDEFYEKLSGYSCVYMSKGVKTIVERPRLGHSLEEFAEPEMPHFVRPEGLLTGQSQPHSLQDPFTRKFN